MIDKEGKLLGVAIAIASDAHLNQIDKGGKPYILHPLHVMYDVRSKDFEVMQISVLHDTVEDCPHYTFKYLEDSGFSKRVIEALKLLTHDKSVPYQDYIKNICKNRDAILVKMADLRYNSNITRLKGLSESDFERIKKYQKAYQFLKLNLKEIPHD